MQVRRPPLRTTGAAFVTRAAALARKALRPALMLVVLGFAVHILLPQVGELEQGLKALRSGRWPYLILAVGAAGLVFVASAWMVHASVSHPPTWGRTIVTQIAAGFSSAVTPAGLGWFAVTQSSLQRAGTDRDEAAAATGLNLVLTVASHIAIVLVLLPFLPVLNLPQVPPPTQRIAVDIVVVAAAVIGVLAWIPRTRRRVIAPILPVLRNVPGVIRDPRRSGWMIAGALAQNLAYTATLLACLAAFGASATPLALLVVYMVAATLAAVSPTPGGLGAMEAALVAGLTRIGVAGGEAVAAVLAFRIVTFWIPLVAGAALLRVAKRRSWI